MRDLQEPRVLVVSHNALHPQGNMGRTLSGLFQSWDRERVRQLYFRQEEPCRSAAGGFYRVTDFDMLRSLWGGRYRGRVTAECAGATARQQAVYRQGRRRKPWQYLTRNLIWRLGRWYTPELREWLAEFQPQVIFFAGGGYTFAYRVAERLGKELNIPVVPYFCDDYYFLDQDSVSPLYRLVRAGIRRRIRRTASAAPLCFAISREMAEAYQREFGTPFFVCMTGAFSRPGSPQGTRVITPERPFRLCYMGRLGLGRAEALAELGRAVVKEGLPMVVEVCTTETDPALLQGLTEENGILFRGALPPEEVLPAMRAADGVLHVESRRKDMTERTRYSLSTKIPDLLASGVCAVAYGPGGLASTDYLERNGAAMVIHGPDEVYRLRELLDPAVRRTLADRGLALAAQNHDGMKNSVELKKKLAGVLTEKEEAG